MMYLLHTLRLRLVRKYYRKKRLHKRKIKRETFLISEVRRGEGCEVGGRRRGIIGGNREGVVLMRVLL